MGKRNIPKGPDKKAVYVEGTAIKKMSVNQNDYIRKSCCIIVIMVLLLEVRDVYPYTMLL